MVVDDILTESNLPKPLTKDERDLVTLRYGENLDKPVSSRLTQKQTVYYYGTLVPKMKKLLSDPTGERKPRKLF